MEKSPSKNIALRRSNGSAKAQDGSRSRGARAVRAKGPSTLSEVASLSPGSGPAISPLAPKTPAELPPLAGVRFAAGAAHIKRGERDDVFLAVFAPGTQVAGVFTRSKTSSAPVEWCRANLVKGQARSLVVNSGNANAFTGKAGLEAVKTIADSTAATVGCHSSEVFAASTGVIGEPLPAQKIIRALPDIFDRCAATGWLGAARAIMTTDTFPKLATALARIDGMPVKINGIAKGSGMIAPDMATLLSFIFTDATLPANVLQPLLQEAANDSFNCVTVDGDTSTSDTLLLFATGRGAKHPPILKVNDKRLADFKEKLKEVAQSLAVQVARDGEGARKLITVRVKGAENDAAARRIALAVGNSPLVKTAIAGEDANWGRVVMAVGKAGEAADRDKMSIKFGSLTVASNGQRHPNYDEERASAYMKKPEIDIEVDVGVGRGSARIWTCDLTHGYISINGDYRS
jgi:glutamate N-acetyltransferase/amino-acid N-acetyltransferase